MEEELKMTVSAVCAKDGERYAFVSFTDGSRAAERKIPECRILSNNGFTEDETRQLEEYMKDQLPKLKRMAAGIRLIDAFKE